MKARLQAYRYGLRAESLCIAYLLATGHRLLGRRVRLPVGEIDLIARRGRTLLFIEVKARRTLEAGLYALKPAQQRRMLQAVNAWLARHPRYAGLDVRCDLMVIARWRVCHLRHVLEMDP